MKFYETESINKSHSSKGYNLLVDLSVVPAVVCMGGAK